MFAREDSEIIQADTVQPIEYLGGVMDEETRPLLKSYIQGLKEGEGALVVFRLGEGDSSDMLLESDIKLIAGHGWNYVSGQEGNSKMQQLVNKLSVDATELRVANKLFSQGSAKIKAFDAHGICFGLIGKGTGEITSIKGIVHQQLNMGLNGDLLLHEGDIIMQSLIKNGVFNDGERQRPIHVQTYGAGGSASEVMNPGQMAVSDGVIDIRTHVDALSTIEYLEQYCQDYANANLANDAEKKGAFTIQAQMIRDKIKDEPDYSGIASVHDMAELARLASAYTGVTTVDIMDGMDSNDKRYFGEITFGTPYYGTTVACRITRDESGNSFTGDDGQTNLVKVLQRAITGMGKVNRAAQQKAIDNLMSKKNDIENNRKNNTAQLQSLLTEKLQPEELEFITKSSEKITRLVEENRGLIQRILDNPDSFEINSQLEQTIEANSKLIGRAVKGQIAIMDEANEDKASYEPLKTSMLSLETKRANSERELITVFHEQTKISESGFRRDTTFNAIEDKRQQMAELAEKNFTKEQTLDFWIAATTIKYLYKDNETAIDLLAKTAYDDTAVIGQLEQRIRMNDALIDGYRVELNDILQSASANLTGEDKITYDTLKKELASLDKILVQQGKALSIATEQHTVLVNADKKLRFFIDKSRSLHDELYPEREFCITACGNIFFTEDDKSAVGKYGAQLVEMENSLFIEIIHHSIANQLYISREHITKIAADPLKIEDHVSSRLNEWASSYTMTVDDYVDAFMWANSGQSFSKFPDSGRWTAAEELFRTDEIAQTRFYNFGRDEVKIVNPFWKEIGTDLVKEIKDGKAFQGKAYERMNFDKDPLKDEKIRLQNMASLIIADPVNPEARVRELFTGYLNLMKPMQVTDELEHEQRYRSYARYIPVLQAGYVGGALSDWDQPIYKSSNTALLDNQASDFLALQGGKITGGGVALTVHSEPPGAIVESSNTILFKMLKAERANNYEGVLALGRQFLKTWREPPEPVEPTPAELFDYTNLITALRADKTKIQDLVEKYAAKMTVVPVHPSYPHNLNAYIRREKITGPRVGLAIEEMRQAEGPAAALEAAEKFLAWKVSTKRNFNVQDIKAMLPKLRREAQSTLDKTSENSISSMKDKLRTIKGEGSEENLVSDVGNKGPG